ncbi:endonuclease MutS2 [Pectinatus haikarae]|uniref:Endonuclease MutS2 n=1 Tax=Pectinatus haikarae TaxID=349096 RepID=A0ABT9Y4D2_9FIRM|nr:endonuclease MutS2 [Pectinatus haikarae]MDQ0202688.1 DNA mismatch repair protein MutS2 [Pectinatus haikarae]
MEQATLKTLQYNKIIDRLSSKSHTTQGREIIKNLLPSDDFEDACGNLHYTEEAVAVLHESEPPFGGIADIRPALKKASMGIVLEAEILVDISGTMYGMRNIKKFFKECPVECPELKSLAVLIEILGQLENEINSVVDEHGFVQDTASNELYRIRAAIKTAKNRVKSTIDNILKNTDMQKFFQENIVTVRDDRYVIPIKQEYRQFFPGIIHDQSSSGSTLFIEPLSIAALNNDIKQYTLNEKKEIERILKIISVKIAKNADLLQQNCHFIAQLDFTFAKAKLALEMKASCPVLNEKHQTDLLKARHPLLEQKSIVPIDIKIGFSYKTLLITGPNTGGKTVSLKTLGLLAAMAQSGLFIPAEDGSKLAFYPQIFANIGDEQSIEQNLSTFSAHITHIINILANAGANDLVLLDELGSGTDPEEGASLAMAVLEKFMEMNVSVVATTHYNELKTFAYSHENIENASVEFDIKTLKPTYRLLTGIPGASNAFAISSRLGLADSIILRAKQLIRADHANFENVLNRLESEKLIYEQKNAVILEKERHIFSLEKKLIEQKEELSRKKNQSIKKAQKDCFAVLRDTRRQAETIIKELKAQFNDSGIKKRQDTIQAAREKLQAGLGKFNRIEQDISPVQGIAADPHKIKPGDIVFLKNIQKQGTVGEVTGNEFVILLGGLKTTVKAKNCLFISSAQKTPQETHPVARSNFSQTDKTAAISRQIDIRGMMVSDAQEILDKYIDDAIMAGLKQIIIIHGKGTGALRKGIHEYLKNHRSVFSYSLADINEGGSGATVVQLQ